MSAFMVGKAHIDALVRLGLQTPLNSPLRWSKHPVMDGKWDLEDVRTLTRETVDTTGQMLVAANLKSIHYLYPETRNGSSVPGGGVEEEAYYYERSDRCPNVVEGLKLIDCYEYQSCEDPGWSMSEARRFCEALRSRLIHRLPGYEEAPWEWLGKVA